MSIRDLASLSKADKALVSRVVSRLIESGLVSKESDTYDARLVQISITEKGLGIFNGVLPHAATRQGILQGILDPDEVAVLDRALDNLTQFAEEKGDDLF